MINKDFFAALDALESEKGISKEYFLDALQTALATAYKRNFNEVRPVEVVLDEGKYSIDMYAYRTVVSEVTNPDSEIALQDAKLIKKTCKLGEKLKQKIAPKEFGRIAASTAKQVITQKLREKEKDSAYGEFSSKVDTLMTGIVTRVDAGNVYIEFPGTNTEGVMAPFEQIATEKYSIGDRIKVYVKKLRETASGVQAICSRSNAGFVKKLFELEVPEIQDGVVEIVNIVREVGYRTKIAINSKDPNVDALGACVGAKGVRVNSIVFQLGGEKIDIIVWSDDPFEYIARALSPAKVISVEIDEITKSARVIVPDDKLSLAIGKGGQNVRLAAKLTNWKIDVKTETKAKFETDDLAHADVDDIGGIFSGTEDISLD